jgi:hypothetical protein
MPGIRPEPGKDSVMITTHEILPKRATVKDRNGELAVYPIQPWNYPITALCAVCGNPVRRLDSMFGDWEHYPPARLGEPARIGEAEAGDQGDADSGEARTPDSSATPEPARIGEA